MAWPASKSPWVLRIVSCCPACSKPIAFADLYPSEVGLLAERADESSLTTPPQIRARARGSALAQGASTGELLLGTSNAPASDDSLGPASVR